VDPAATSPRGQLRQLTLVLQAFLYLLTRQEGQEIVVGADGSGGICRWAIPQEARNDNFVEYPFAWFGILCEAPPSSEELIYCHSDRGFALNSQRRHGSKD
jgi:2-polyprenyl-6-methoxyphenol hydroxylase-like FAD-dependent oxidoreductase